MTAGQAPVGEPAQDLECRRHRVGPEEDPGNDQVEGDDSTHRAPTWCVGERFQPLSIRRSARHRSHTSQAPCNPPQNTKFQAAPCHKPPSSMVSIRFR